MVRMYDSRKRILVTGGVGFLGSHLIDRLLEQGHELLCADNLFTGTKRTARYIDVKRIRSILDNSPAETPLNPKSHGYASIPVSIGSALATGRFVRRVKESNR